MRLTSSFTSEDFAVSSSFPQLVRAVPDELMPRVRALAVLLQELQDWLDLTYGRSRYRIVITSGYRPDELNAAVGGSSRSLHRTGHAVDFVVLDGNGRAAPELLSVLYGHIARTMTGRVGEVELSTRHIHITNPTAGNADEFMVLLREPMKVFARPPNEAELAVIAAAVGAVIAVRSL